MSRFQLSLVLLIAIARATVAAEEVHWPGFLGPERSGWVEHFQPPKIWPDQLQQQWQRDVGDGYASPLVSGGRVYQYARVGEEETLWCLDIKSGDIVWKKSWPVPFKMGGGGGGEWHGKGPKGAPVLADGRLFTMGISGILTAWNTETGEQLWQRDHSANYEKLTHPYWGATTSPIVDGGRVVVHFGNDKKGVLIAHDVETGKELWKQDKDAPSYSSPLIATFHGVRQLVEWNHRALVGIDLETGDHLWEYPFEHVGTNQNMPTPAIYKDRLIVGGENRGLRSVQPVLKEGKWSAIENWNRKKLALDMSTPVIHGDYVYGFTHLQAGHLFCADAKTGEMLWQGPKRIGENVSFLAIRGHVVALLDKGEMQIISAAGKDSKQVASYLVADQPTWAAPVLLSDGVLVKDKQKLTLWRIQ